MARIKRVSPAHAGLQNQRPRLTRGAAVEAILDGTEKITKETRCSR
jgi:hypothetical protein